MPRMNKRQFIINVLDCETQYDQQNQWFGFQRGGPVWSQGTWVDFIEAAWKLYTNASAIPNRIILLGDTKIRSDPSLVFNFGLVANSSSPQDKKDKLMISELMYDRRKNQQKCKDDRKKAEEIIGTGNILSVRRWSPMLNDALMIAGTEQRCDFIFTHNEEEAEYWVKKTNFEKTRAKFGTPFNFRHFKHLTLEQEKFLIFLKENPRVLWENNTPRVFARELLGLKEFGFVPDFNDAQLGFKRAWTAQITFKNYLDCLQRVNFHAPDRLAIMEAISDFLFNDPNLLSDIGA